MRKILQADQPPAPVALYARVSGEEQEKRETIQNQRDFFARWTELHGIPVAGMYEDDGVTGTIPLGDRPGGARLLEDVRAGKVREIVVYRVDRIGRDARVILEALAALEDAGARTRSMTEPFDNATPGGRFLLGILAVVAGFERDSILERTRAGKRRRAALGAWQGGPPPYGYKIEGHGPSARLALATDEWVEQVGLSAPDLVAKIFHDLAGGATALSLAQRLNALGVPSPAESRGRAVRIGWSASSISGIVRNPVHKGEHQHGRRTDPDSAISRPCPAIVTPEIWTVATQRLLSNRNLSKSSSTREYLLRGIVKCALCGSSYIGRTHAGRDKVVEASGRTIGMTYSCRRRIECGQFGYERCNAPRISGALEGVVWQTLVQYLQSPATLQALLSQPHAQQEGQAAQARLEKLLRGKALERERVATMTRRGMLDFAAAEHQLAEINQEEAALKAEMEHATSALAASSAQKCDAEFARALVESVAELLSGPGEISFAIRRMVIERLVEKIIIEPIPGVIERHGKYNAARASLYLKFGPPAK